MCLSVHKWIGTKSGAFQYVSLPPSSVHTHTHSLKEKKNNLFKEVFSEG